jgi:hypothetical protein
MLMEMKQDNTDFISDIKKGKIGEDIFIEDFLNFLNIKYEDVTGSQGFQIIDSDFLTKIGLYEIKTNYKDDEFLIIEEYTNCNELYGKKSFGWFYKTKADLLIFISKKTRTMIFLPFTEKFKNHYSLIRKKTELIKNKVTVYGDKKWQSAFRKIPLELLNGYISIYMKKLTSV